MRILTIVAVLLSVSDVSTSQVRAPIKATPLSVCEVMRHPKEWDNQVVLIKAHYGYGMEDSFLWDERCRGGDIDLDYPSSASREDISIHDLAYEHRIPVELMQDENFRRFKKLTSERSGMCPKRDVLIEAVGRLDSVRHFEEKNPNCRLDFGMCNYSARFVLKSVKQVQVTDVKPACK